LHRAGVGVGFFCDAAASRCAESNSNSNGNGNGNGNGNSWERRLPGFQDLGGWAGVLVGADLGPHYLSDVMNRRRNRPCLRTLATIESRCMSQIARSIATVAPPAFEAA
jgi:hypothetical protein